MAGFNRKSLTPPNQREYLKAFRTTMAVLDDSERAAICNNIPMTQELFDDIVNKCTGEEFEGFIIDFMLHHSDFLEVHAERLETELAKLQDLDPAWYEPMPGKPQTSWDKLFSCMWDEYGDDEF